MTQSATNTIDDPNNRRDRIRELNDALRTGKMLNPEQCSILITKGVNALGLPFVLEVTDAIKRFDAFTSDNDPYGERDFGAVDIQSEKVFWKIDYYDSSLQFGSPDPTDPNVTHRVMTIMLANEY